VVHNLGICCALYRHVPQTVLIANTGSFELATNMFQERIGSHDGGTRRRVIEGTV
jgi:hypothetical protein